MDYANYYRYVFFYHKIASRCKNLLTVLDDCLLLLEEWVQPHKAGVDPGFFLAGGAPLRNGVTDW